MHKAFYHCILHQIILFNLFSASLMQLQIPWWNISAVQLISSKSDSSSSLLKHDWLMTTVNPALCLTFIYSSIHSCIHCEGACVRGLGKCNLLSCRCHHPWCLWLKYYFTQTPIFHLLCVIVYSYHWTSQNLLKLVSLQRWTKRTPERQEKMASEFNTYSYLYISNRTD